MDGEGREGKGKKNKLLIARVYTVLMEEQQLNYIDIIL